MLIWATFGFKSEVHISCRAVGPQSLLILSLASKHFSVVLSFISPHHLDSLWPLWHGLPHKLDSHNNLMANKWNWDFSSPLYPFVRMRIGERTGQSEKQLFRAGEIPTWQWLWSVFPALTWNGFSSHATRLNLGTPFIRRNPPRDRCDPNSPTWKVDLSLKKQVRTDSLGIRCVGN